MSRPVDRHAGAETDIRMRPSSLCLSVRDLGRTRAFYESVLGLRVLDETATRVTLGVGKQPLLHLETRPGLIAAGPRAAGLFHAAFLLPDRPSLGAWLAHAAGVGAPIVGASDHIVSEAIYLSDPEGNGVEVYCDRPAAAWRGADGAIKMSTGPLDLDALLQAAAGRKWSGFPETGQLGHIHLQVGDTVEADRFWQEVLGLDLTTRYPGASFYATGGYHHHVAANVWNSRNAPRRTANLTGLHAFQMALPDRDGLEAALSRIQAARKHIDTSGDTARLRDPWNIEIELKVEQSHAG